jgi:hypothetical protein
MDERLKERAREQGGGLMRCQRAGVQEFFEAPERNRCVFGSFAGGCPVCFLSSAGYPLFCSFRARHLLPKAHAPVSFPGCVPHICGCEDVRKDIFK